MAGRPRTIDRDKVLDAAEAIVTQQGAAALTIDAVAKASKITKGGMQYCFVSKDNLLRAMIDRWQNAFDDEVERYVAADPQPNALIRGHLLATRDGADGDQSRSAVMLTTLLQQPQEVAASREWYLTRLAGLNYDIPTDRRAAIAFIAGEGAFLLRALGFVEFEASDWEKRVSGFNG